MHDCFLGVDVGSVSTNFVLTDENDALLEKLYLRNHGQPIESILQGVRTLSVPDNCRIAGVGATGSGRRLAGVLLGADAVKNEITAHGVAATKVCPEVRTVLEIGGQDSKIIFIENGVITDFHMNTVCAAGTGSFLDRTAGRLGVEVSQIGDMALKANADVRIAGRCAVFAESDMIHKQQDGMGTEELLMGLCDALVRGYLNNLCRGRKIEGPVLFQGGVAANKGIKRCFEKELGLKVIVPPHFDCMGAWGAAVLAREQKKEVTAFRGFNAMNEPWETHTLRCDGCANTCTVSFLSCAGEDVAHWGSRCNEPKVGTLKTV